MNLMCSQNTSKGWYYDGKHIGMNADSSTVFSDFYTARSQNLFRTHHRLDSLHPSSHGHCNDSTGGPVLSPCPRRLPSILSRCEIFADRTLENPGPSAGHGICAERNHPAGPRRYPVSSKRPKGRRRWLLARRCPLDPNENRLRLGSESCRSHVAGSAALGRWGGEPLGLPINMRLHRKQEKTLIQLAEEMIEEITLWFPSREFRIVADGFYASLAGTDLLHTTIISRMRRDAMLYDLPPKRKSSGKVRPRKRGKILPKPEGLASHVRPWTKVKFTGRGCKRTRLVYSRQVLWYKVSPSPVLLVISRDPA